MKIQVVRPGLVSFLYFLSEALMKSMIKIVWWFNRLPEQWNCRAILAELI